MSHSDQQLRDAICTDLPAFPVDVVDEWLLPYATSVGWPPAHTPSAIPTNRWRYILGGRPLAHFQSMEWKPAEVDLRRQPLTVESKRSLGQMASGAFLGTSNIYTEQIPDLEARVLSVHEYVREHAVLPVMPALEQQATGLHVLDGNHRLTAWIVAAGAMSSPAYRDYVLGVEIPFSAWVGTRTAGHSP